MREQKTKAQVQKNKLWDNTPAFYESTPPSHIYPIPPIIHNNNTMDKEFLVQMRQSTKCGSVKNDEIFNLRLGSGASPWISISCLLQDTIYVYWFHPLKQLIRKKQRTEKWHSIPNKLYRTGTALAYVHRTKD